MSSRALLLFYSLFVKCGIRSTETNDQQVASISCAIFGDTVLR